VYIKKFNALSSNNIF